jgi:hypothetical protein
MEAGLALRQQRLGLVALLLSEKELSGEAPVLGRATMVVAFVLCDWRRASAPPGRLRERCLTLETEWVPGRSFSERTALEVVAFKIGD